ncbi:MAG TPA: nuclear transport factor 2 family protein [Cellvibrio sp.]|nr:nuclear transport factor 2 family protein [Cellvibrio sp.]
MTINLPQAVRELYLQFDPAILDKLTEVYADNIQFVDPLHTLSGIAAMRGYFAATMNGLDECRFEFHRSLEQLEQGEAVLLWTMHYRHRKLAGGKPLSLAGSSHLRFAEKVYYHRDYYDAGAMLYEQVPLLGGIIRHIKQQVGQQ